MPEVYKLPRVRMWIDMSTDETLNVRVYIGTK